MHVLLQVDPVPRFSAPPVEHSAVFQAERHLALPTGHGVTLPVFGVPLAVGVGDPGDGHGVCALPAVLLLLQGDHLHRALRVPNAHRHSHFGIGRAHVGQVHRLPALLQITRKNRYNNSNQHGKNGDHRQKLHHGKTSASVLHLSSPLGEKYICPCKKSRSKQRYCLLRYGTGSGTRTHTRKAREPKSRMSTNSIIPAS